MSVQTFLGRVAPALLIWAGVAACVLGFALHRMWLVLPWARFGDHLLLAALAVATAAGLRRWRGWSWASGLAGVWLVALLFFVGLLPLLAVLLLAATAFALGSLLVPRDSAGAPALALPVGLVLIAGVAGWLLPLPLHHQHMYAPLLLAICVARRHTLAMAAHATLQGWRDAVAGAPFAAAFAVLLLGLTSTAAWLPTMQFDDLAYHLGLPTHLLLHGAYRPDPAEQIWALAPWLGDVVHGIAQVLAGREARGAVDVLWLLAAATALWHLAATLHADRRIRWLSVALFASLPLTASLSAGMQTELPATCLLLALATLIAGPRDPRLLYAGAALAAGLFALKFGHAVAALVLLLWALLRARGRLDWPRLPLAIAVFVVLAGSSYFHAWRISGNPMLPLFNDVFRSPLLAPRQLGDLRWHAGFGLDLPWGITFGTARYLEAWDGGFGFVLIALAGAWLLALRHVGTRHLALAASAVLLLPMLPMQYARYAFPGLVLLLAPLLVATSAALGARRCAVVVVALCALNLAFQTNANWLLRVNALRTLVGSGGETSAVFGRYAPERALIAELRRRDDGGSAVLALDARNPHIAELAGRGHSVAWYAPRLERARIAADADASGARWQALFEELDARWLLLRPAQLSPAQQAALAGSGAIRVSAIGGAELWARDAAAETAAVAQP